MGDIQALIDATWPAAAIHRAGPWLVRQGQGGGKRVSAATAAANWHAADIPLAEEMQQRLGQPSLFIVRSDEPELDSALADRGYGVVDPVLIWSAPVQALAGPLPPLAAFTLSPPLAVQSDIWSEGGIGPERRAVMDRVGGPKTTILSRSGDRASGVAFVACHHNQAMLHALHVLPAARRQGSASNIMRAAANWAQDQGAATLSLAVTRANAPASALYASLNMRIVGDYHYRRNLARERQNSS